MTPRQRILATLEHRQVDRVPVDFAGTDCTSAHAIAYDRLRRHLGIQPRPIRLACLIQQVAEADPEVAEQLGGQAVGLFHHPKTWRLWKSGYGFDLEVPDGWRPETQSDGATVVRDAAGTVRTKRPADGLYFDPVRFVFADVQRPEELDEHASVFQRWDWPTVNDESIDAYAARAKKLRAATDRAIVASWRMHYLQAGQIMRGYEQFMIDLLCDETLVRAMLDRLHAAYLARAGAMLEALGEAVDVVFFTDDLGTQNGPLISPDVYRRLIKPYWTELIALIKEHDKKVLMHACGAVSQFIPDLIDMGVDALNPVQITAADMAPERLKREFGKDITFWGGGINTQGGLDGGTPASIAEEVRRNIDTFAAGGGYVFTQVHNIQANVPPENIIAAYETAVEGS